jgi:hypothetical protein
LLQGSNIGIGSIPVNQNESKIRCCVPRMYAYLNAIAFSTREHGIRAGPPGHHSGFLARHIWRV